MDTIEHFWNFIGTLYVMKTDYYYKEGRSRTTHVSALSRVI